MREQYPSRLNQKPFYRLMGRSLQPSAMLLGLSPADIYYQNCECLLPREKHLWILSNTACAWTSPSAGRAKSSGLSSPRYADTASGDLGSGWWAQTWLENSSSTGAGAECRSWHGAGFLCQLISCGYCGKQECEGDPEWRTGGSDALLLSVHHPSEEVWRQGGMTLAHFLQRTYAGLPTDLGNLLCLVLPPVFLVPSHSLSHTSERFMRVLGSCSTSAWCEKLRSCSDSSIFPPLSPFLLQYFHWSILKASAEGKKNPYIFILKTQKLYSSKAVH